MIDAKTDVGPACSNRMCYLCIINFVNRCFPKTGSSESGGKRSHQLHRQASDYSVRLRLEGSVAVCSLLVDSCLLELSRKKLSLNLLDNCMLSFPQFLGCKELFLVVFLDSLVFCTTILIKS